MNTLDAPPSVRWELRPLDRLAVSAGRLSGRLLRRVLRRGGSAVPGLVADAVSPGLLLRALQSHPLGVIVVTGSAGKSTTTKMLTALLRGHGLTVFTNPSTANMRQGIVSAVLDEAGSGLPPADIAVLELDEVAAAALAGAMDFRMVVATNVLKDQLDRFRSPGRVAEYIAAAASAAETIVANADDGFLTEMLPPLGAPIHWFGAAADLRPASALGFGYARESGPRHAGLPRGTRVEASDADSALLDLGGEGLLVELPAPGVHYAMDAAAAIEAARNLLGEAFSPYAAHDALAATGPVFARGERIEVRGETVELVLVQNLASFQLNLDQLEPSPEQVLVAVGSDVADPSWLWSVELGRLGAVTAISGSRAHDLALRLLYAGVPVDSVEPDLSVAIEDFLALPTPSRGRKTIILTADPMRRVRRMLELELGVGLGLGLGRSVAR